MSVDRFGSSPRAVSPVIGYVLIVSIVLAGIFIIFIGGGAIADSLSQPRSAAVFEPEIESSDEVGIEYVSGDEFSPENTERIRVVNTENETDEVVFSGNATLSEGEFLVAPSENVSGVKLNTTLEIIWEDTEGGDRIIDKVYIPGEKELGPSVQSGSGDGSGGFSPDDDGDGGGGGGGGDDGVEDGDINIIVE
jgi:FlaG/FlaF family flagellin (archaellin)